ncbi:MAG: hypothetical protein ACXWOH_00980 [Bdellovibrionota bacterium]
MKTPNDSGNGPSSPPPLAGLVSMQKILLKRYFFRGRQAGVNTRPLIRQLLMLFAHVSVGRGNLAMLQDTLLRQPTPSMIQNAHLQLSLLREDLMNLESTLDELLNAYWASELEKS